jgi:hypothetical protein
LHDVQQIDWEDVLPVSEDVNLIFESFHAKISETIDNHVPLRRLSKKQVRLLAKHGLQTALGPLYKLIIDSINYI